MDGGERSGGSGGDATSDATGGSGGTNIGGSSHAIEL